MVPRQRGHAEAELRLGRVAAAGQDPRACRQRGCGLEPVDDAVAAPEGASRQVDSLAVVEVARHRNDGIGRPVRRRPEGTDAVRRQTADVRLLAADLATKRARPEHRLLEQDLGVLAGVVEVAADLLDDDLALAVDLGHVQRGAADELAEHGHRPFRLAPRHAHPVDGRLAIGGGIERAADALDRLAEGASRREGCRALEGQVLEEVGHPGLVAGLEARAGPHVRGRRH